MISIDDIYDYDNKSNKFMISNNTSMYKKQSINNKRISFLETMNSSESIVSPIDCSSSESFIPIDNHKIPSISTKVFETCTTKMHENPTLLDAIVQMNHSIESNNKTTVNLLDLLIKNNQSMILAVFELIETNKKNSNSLNELHHKYFKSERILRLQNAIQNSDDTIGQNSFRSSLCIYIKSIGINTKIEKNDKGNYVLVESNF
jgi:hypothetical protein